MPVIEIQGNLLESDCNIIAHGCNCFNTMGSGVARAIRAKYPEVYEIDCKTTRGDRKKLGSYSYTPVYDLSKTPGDDNLWFVLNLYTQYNFGTEVRQLDYETLANCLEALKTFCAKYPTAKVGLPRIGCGLAGGDWSVVKAFIEATFPDKDIYVYYL
jgi:O-acetyl-ADP-ribose deacetylase (regulator of RNase III)